jgi:hypothetical protein
MNGPGMVRDSESSGPSVIRPTAGSIGKQYAANIPDRDANDGVTSIHRNAATKKTIFSEGCQAFEATNRWAGFGRGD